MKDKSRITRKRVHNFSKNWNSAHLTLSGVYPLLSLNDQSLKPIDFVDVLCLVFELDDRLLV